MHVEKVISFVFNSLLASFVILFSLSPVRGSNPGAAQFKRSTGNSRRKFAAGGETIGQRHEEPSKALFAGHHRLKGQRQGIQSRDASLISYSADFSTEISVAKFAGCDIKNLPRLNALALPLEAGRVPADEASARLTMPLSKSPYASTAKSGSRSSSECAGLFARGRVHAGSGLTVRKEFNERSQEVVENKGDHFLDWNQSQQVSENKEVIFVKPRGC